MQSFSQKTKEMLCRAETGRSCCAAAELAGLVLYTMKSRGGVRLVTENGAVAERIVRLAERCFGARLTAVWKKSCFVCSVSDGRLLKKILGEMCDFDECGCTVKNVIVKKSCCRGAFLRGAFLGGGTIVDPNKNYNLEFITSNESLCSATERLLSECGFEFRRTERRGSCVLYSKNSETICDLLTLMGAFGSNMEILNVKIERELRNNLNRAANGETANFDKVIKAAVRQIKAIEKIERTAGLDSLPQELRETAQLRMRFKDLSLDELGKKVTPCLTKSGINHRLKKIIDIADAIDD